MLKTIQITATRTDDNMIDDLKTTAIEIQHSQSYRLSIYLNPLIVFMNDIRLAETVSKDL